MVCRNFILPEFCKPCLFLSFFQFAQLIVPYHPIRRNLLPGASGGDAVLGIAYRGIIDVAAGANILIHDSTFFHSIRSSASAGPQKPCRDGPRRESVRFCTSRWDCPGVAHRIWHKFFWARLRSCLRSVHRTFHISNGALLLILGDTCQVQHWDICVCTLGI